MSGAICCSQRAGRDPVTAFVGEMNSLIANQGAIDTKFTNPHGMDHQGEAPYSTAADMARLAIYAMGKASFRFYASQTERKISYSRGGRARSFLMKNTNKLLGVDSIDGVKTGMTRRRCLPNHQRGEVKLGHRGGRWTHPRRPTPARCRRARIQRTVQGFTLPDESRVAELRPMGWPAAGSSAARRNSCAPPSGHWAMI